MTRDRAELAAGDGGRHADLPHRRCGHLGGDAVVHADAVDAVDIVDAVGEAELHGLGAVGDRAAADRDDQVGARLARRVGRGDHRLPRRMRRHGVEQAGAAGTEGMSDPCDFVGLTVQRAGDHQEGSLRSQPVHLRDNGLGRRMAEHDLLDRAVNDTSLVHACPPRTIRLVFVGVI